METDISRGRLTFLRNYEVQFIRPSHVESNKAKAIPLIFMVPTKLLARISQYK